MPRAATDNFFLIVRLNVYYKFEYNTIKYKYLLRYIILCEIQIFLEQIERKLIISILILFHNNNNCPRTSTSI